jgi:hypothetical protein
MVSSAAETLAVVMPMFRSAIVAVTVRPPAVMVAPLPIEASLSMSATFTPTAMPTAVPSELLLAGCLTSMWPVPVSSSGASRSLRPVSPPAWACALVS